MSEAQELYYESRLDPDASRQLVPLMGAFRAAALANPISYPRLFQTVEAVLQFLTAPTNRTDDNCRAVDSAIMSDDELWLSLESLERSHDELHDIIADMAGALHDTVSAPEIAGNFESTPEQLLSRLDAIRSWYEAPA
jgi:hypothetical protein